jgi:cytochrome c oxidase accessory protein FixG
MDIDLSHHQRIDGNVLSSDETDYRDQIPTYDKKGKRLWIYPRQPVGTLYRWRTWVSWGLLAILFLGPFIRINGNPLLMINIVERKYSIFGVIFYPQDNFLLALGMIAFFIGIALFTAVFGRVWCGWLCPQTVLMELVFRKIEYFIEGDATEQRVFSAAPWTKSKFVKKGIKHAIFFGLSFLIGNLLLAYIIGTEGLFAIVFDNPLNHLGGLTAMVLFSLLFYGIFSRFREQACTFICPYGRFQSVLLDENSLVVAYDWKRGNPSGRFRRKIPVAERRASGVGDCINCHMCVDVCPTGIDIRNGTQMECVNCTACIDACDGVMRKLGMPTGLIRYASLNGIAKGEKFRFTPRTVAYCAILAALVFVISFMVGQRSLVEASVLRAPGSLYQEQPNGDISNLYLVKMLNKKSDAIELDLRLEEPRGTVTIPGGTLRLEPQGRSESAAVVALPRSELTEKNRAVVMGLYEGDRLVKRFKSSFVAPAGKKMTE